MRTALAIPAIVVVTVVYSVAVSIHMLLWRNTDVFFAYARSWSKKVLWLSGVHVTVQGAEHLVPSERYIYAANHTSLFDIPVILAFVPDNVRIMYKQELEKIPVFGWGLRLSPFISINRERSREAISTLDEAVISMQTGSSVLVFPEGTRSKDGSLGTFKRGAFTMAVRAGRRIVPMSIQGAHRLLPQGKLRLLGGSVVVALHKPLDVPEQATREQEKELMSTVREIIATDVVSQS
jgi:1-acyl-sn-glycerol-3-phosphate acyltransferase